MGGNHGGRYVKCDYERCDETFSLNLRWYDDELTLKAARQAGWYCSPARGKDRRDFCPQHRNQINRRD